MFNKFVRGKSGNNINIEVTVFTVLLCSEYNLRNLRWPVYRDGSVLRRSVYLGGKWPVYRDGQSTEITSVKMASVLRWP